MQGADGIPVVLDDAAEDGVTPVGVDVDDAAVLSEGVLEDVESPVVVLDVPPQAAANSEISTSNSRRTGVTRKAPPTYC